MALPAVPGPGVVGLRTRVTAEPGLTVKLPLVAGSSDPSVAVIVYVPALVIKQPAKLTTPEFSVPEQFDSPDVPPEVMASLTVDESVVTTLPPASSTVTTGWILKAVPAAVGLLGDVVKASCVAAPTDTVMPPLVAGSSVPSLAVRV
jgi:hypothetical protein